MPNETSAIKAKTRRVKDHVLDKFLMYVDKLARAEELSEFEKVIYKDMLLTFAKNVIPRTTELTGEEGEAVKITLVNYANNQGQVSTEALPDTANTSV